MKLIGLDKYYYFVFIIWLIWVDYFVIIKFCYKELFILL